MNKKKQGPNRNNVDDDELERLQIELVPRLDLPLVDEGKDAKAAGPVLEIEELDGGWDDEEELSGEKPVSSKDGEEDSAQQQLEPADAANDIYVHPGEIVAEKYRVEEVLGLGGMAFVVAVTHVELGERFALKFLNRDLLGERNIVDRFTQESRAACRIRSEHVARVYDVGTHNGAPFFVMEHLEGRDLAMVLADSDRKGLPIGQAVEWVMQACDALAVAHHHGIIHRDIKPENLFLVEHSGLPSIKLLDFGISKLSLAGGTPTGVDARLTGHFSLGTPSYMSPEQIRSASSADTRSDLWSLGVVLYELLVGHEPFRAPSIPELCAAVADEEPKRVCDLRPEVPRELSNVVHKCLQKNPDDRFSHVAELAMALLPFAPSRALVSAERSSELMKKTPPAGITPPPPSSQRMKAAAPQVVEVAPAAVRNEVLKVSASASTSLPDLRFDEEDRGDHEELSPHSGQPVSRSVPPHRGAGSRLPMFAAAAVLLIAAGFAAIRFGQPLLQPITADVNSSGTSTSTSAPATAAAAAAATTSEEEAPQVAIRAASFTREKEREGVAAPSASASVAPPAASPATTALPIILPSGFVPHAASSPPSKPKASAPPLAPAPAPGGSGSVPAPAATIELGY